jgi:hypothetical protein
VRWNGAARSTTFVSSARVRAAIPSTDIAASGTAQVSVLTPSGTATGTLPFSIAAAPAGDTQKPSVAMDFPWDWYQANPGEFVNAQALAKDNVGVVEVRFYVDGQLKCSDRSAPWGCGFALPTAAGQHYLMVQAFDAAGNMGTQTINIWTGP